MGTVRRVCAALVCATACQAALADRSRIEDEEDVVEFGDCALELGFVRQTARGSAAERESALQLDCGIGWQTELALAFVRTRGREAHDDAIALEGKTSLRESRLDRVGWAFAYGILTERSDGGAWHTSEHFLALEATVLPAENWFLEASLGTLRERIAHRHSTLWSLSVEHAVVESVELLAEMGGDDRSRPEVVLGVRYLFSWPEDALLTLTWGTGGGPPRERRVGLALTYEF